MSDREEGLCTPMHEGSICWAPALSQSRDTLGLPPLNPYGLAKYTVLITAISLVILVPLDWVFPSGTRATQLGVDNADRTIPHLVRLVVLSVMILYIVLTGWDPGAYGFTCGRALLLLAVYVFTSAFYSAELTDRLVYGLKSVPWIFAAIASYRLTLGGYVSARILRRVAGAVVVVSSAYTIPFCMDPSRRVGQNADSSVVLWCIPLLLLFHPPLWAVTLSGLASVAIFVTVKRGAVLALVAGGFVYSILMICMSSREHKARDLLTVVLAVTVVACGFIWQWENTFITVLLQSNSIVCIGGCI